jgi:hypothetical protein
MKSRIIGRTAKTMLFATVLLATCLSASSANAQSAFDGKFTLPYEAHWGKAVLPAGDYLLSISATENPPTVIIQDARSGRRVAMVVPSIREDTTGGGSTLLIGYRGAQRVIHSFRVAELGVVFVSDPGLAHGRAVREEEARKTQVVPILQAKK